MTDDRRDTTRPTPRSAERSTAGGWGVGRRWMVVLGVIKVMVVVVVVVVRSDERSIAGGWGVGPNARDVMAFGR